MFMSREFVRQIKKTKQSSVVQYTRQVHLASSKETTINKILNTTIKVCEVRLEGKKKFN